MDDALFRTLDPQEEQQFRGWAREHWTPGDPVNPVWHPVVRDEIRRMQVEASWPVDHEEGE